MQKAVNGRMTDPNIAVREATAELIGKYVVSKPEIIQQYYNVLVQRIMVGLQFTSLVSMGLLI